jgi:hypothetical protein
MATDRMREYEGRCLCGKGELEIDLCSPDHGWPTANPFWYETRISCEACAANYEVQGSRGEFLWVAKSELAGRVVLRNQAETKAKELMTSDSATKATKALINLLHEQRSVAACYRLLKTARLEFYAIGSFRKYWSTPEQWVERHIDARNLMQVVTFLKIAPDEGLKQYLAEIDQLHAAANAPLTPLAKIPPN